MKRPLLEAPRELSVRASEALDIVDPATLVPGGLAGLALLYLGEIDSRLGVEMSTLGAVAAGVIFSCALGHLCFSVGRLFRRFVNPWRRIEVTQALVGAMRAHNLNGETRYKSYFNHPTGLPDAAALVPRLWAEVRRDPARAASYTYLRRLWQRAAILDGMIPAITVWIAVTVLAVIEARGVGTEFYVGIPLLLCLVGAVVVAAREAGRTDRHLLEELVATVADSHDYGATGATARPTLAAPSPPVASFAPAAFAPVQAGFAPVQAVFAPVQAPFAPVQAPFAPPPVAAQIATTPPVQPSHAMRDRESLQPAASLEEVVFRPSTLISGTPIQPQVEPKAEPKAEPQGQSGGETGAG